MGNLKFNFDCYLISRIESGYYLWYTVPSIKVNGRFAMLSRLAPSDLLY
jgi:hypothetical protein